MKNQPDPRPHRHPTASSVVTLLGALLALIVLTGCPKNGPDTGGPYTSGATDPLPSWQEGAAKKTILDFVAKVTSRSSSGYVKPEKRVAVFDQDGTLWCEKPVSGMEPFAQSLIAPGPQPCKNLPPGKCEPSDIGDDWLTEDCPKGAKKFDEEAQKLAELFALKLSSVSQLQEDASAFLNDPEYQHPRFCVPYIETVYLPMVELLAYLKSKGFRLFIISGGAQPFMTAYSRQAYGVHESNVIGTTVVFELDTTVTPPDTKILPKLLFRMPHLAASIWTQKAVNVQTLIGLQPLIAAGNSICGDFWMLEAATTGPLPSLGLVIDHDDAKREYCYADPLTEVAKKKGWTVVSMKDDFAKIFSFQ
ncbi:MAG: haloacid dehalogenase-like hydrolase [Holophagales bacterium]|nr:haloacid dehalogenase-like hydrolase [Holophagales bacterium]